MEGWEDEEGDVGCGGWLAAVGWWWEVDGQVDTAGSERADLVGEVGRGGGGRGCRVGRQPPVPLMLKVKSVVYAGGWMNSLAFCISVDSMYPGTARMLTLPCCTNASSTLRTLSIS